MANAGTIQVRCEGITGATMRFAYADPPYIGQAKRHYSHDPLCAEVDHEALLVMLRDEFPDGWCLSASSPSLEEILHLCRRVLGPNKVRIGSWGKNFGAFKRGVRPAYMWEPFIFVGGRNPSNGYRHLPPERNGKQNTPKDFIVEPITLKKGLVGAKPAKVCRWVLVDLLPRHWSNGRDSQAAARPDCLTRAVPTSFSVKKGGDVS